MLKKIGVTEERRIMLYISDTISLKSDSLTAEDSSGPTILLGSRLNLLPQKDQSLGEKCIDVFLDGYLKYVKSGGEANLKLFKKGENAKEVINWSKEHGLEKKIIVEKQVPLATFYKHIRSANIIADSFGQNTMPGMVTTDSYALGKPVIANLRNDIFGSNEIPKLPGLNAASSDEVYHQLCKAMKDTKLLEELGQQSRRFAVKYLSPEENAKRLLKKVKSIVKENTT